MLYLGLRQQLEQLGIPALVVPIALGESDSDVETVDLLPGKLSSLNESSPAMTRLGQARSTKP